jgi:2-amino-4-hydroxy-6-hydroxymethyldihydropteridine diphosphokinase
MSVVYLSLGSNLGNRETNLQTAIAKLDNFGKVEKASSFYETEPVEFTDQPWFLNCAVEMTTSLQPRQLLDAVLQIERSMGRRRIEPKGPRTIDIDILLFGDASVNEPGLQIPHPAMHERRFVLEPLAEIAPEVRHPLSRVAVRDMLLEISDGPVVKKLIIRRS